MDWCRFGFKRFDVDFPSELAFALALERGLTAGCVALEWRFLALRKSVCVSIPALERNCWP